MKDSLLNDNKTIIIGASGLGREIHSCINLSNQSKVINVIGFLDDNKDALDNYNMDVTVLDVIDFNIVKRKNAKLIIGIADCNFKQKIFENSKINECELLSYFHESTLIGLRSLIGIGVVMMPNSVVSCDVVIGNGVFINMGSQIGHDSKIGDFTSVMANVDIGGGVVIGNNVFIGSNAVILPGVVIPDYTRIGAGSVVLKTIKQSGSYFGNPVKKIF